MFGIQNNIIGIDIDEQTVACCELIKQKAKICLNDYRVVSNLKELSGDSGFKTKSCAVSLPTQSLLTRSFAVGSNLIKAKDKDKAIANFLQKQNLSLKSDEFYSNTLIFNNYLYLVSVKKSTVEKYLAQVKERGFNIVGIIPPFLAFYNLIVFNYGIKDSFLMLNLRSLSTDFLIFESKQLSIYPLPWGRQYLKNPDNQNSFIAEIHRTFNNYYLQNPSHVSKPSPFYLIAPECPDSFGVSLKTTFGDCEIINVDPLKKISSLKKDKPDKDMQVLSLSLGLGLTYFNVSGGIAMNLVKEKLKNEQTASRISLIKKVSNMAACACVLLLFVLAAKLGFDYAKQSSAFKTNQFRVISILPEVRQLRQEEESLTRLKGFLLGQLYRQNLYLKALKVISESKSPFIEIQEMEAKSQGAKVDFFLSLQSPSYEEINEFLSKLKKDPNLKDAKMVASTVTDKKAQTQNTVNFKLHFEIGS